VREQVLHYIRERKLLKAGDRAAVAVSGGADSVALLRVLLELREELGVVLVVAHFNHQLRGVESDGDEHFVAELAAEHDLPFFAGRGDVRRHAEINQRSLEHAARILRYMWMHELAPEQRLDAIATAHTRDDQVETVLMKFLRGAGTRGLAGIHPIILMSHLPAAGALNAIQPTMRKGHLRVVRPLLEASRADIEAYLASLNQPWREDRSNRDTQHLRNRIRHELLPWLEREYNPNLRQVLSQSAEIALSEEDYWHEHASSLAVRWHQEKRRLRLQEKRAASTGFLSCGVAVQRRTLKQFLEWHGIIVDFHHIEAARMCALGDGSTVSLPGGWQARRKGDCLELFAPTSTFEVEEFTRRWQYSLPVPGRCGIAEAGITLEAVLVSPEFAALEPPGSLLRASALGPELVVRNWHPGDRFRPSHTGSAEKLKRLFSEKRIPARHRPLWPVALSGSLIVWVRGFPPAHDYAWAPGSGDAVKIDVLNDK
jgi:tRNA(Ile)-lysidine synthase